jgi:hypothetical protein
MRLTKVCGPRASQPLLKWPQATLDEVVWLHTHGFPMKSQRVTQAGWADVGPEPQWLEAGWTIVDECHLEKS